VDQSERAQILLWQVPNPQAIPRGANQSIPAPYATGENGQRVIGDEAAKKLAAVLNIDYQLLLDRS